MALLRILAASAVSLALAFPAAAAAGTVTRSDASMTYTADGAADENVTVGIDGTTSMAYVDSTRGVTDPGGDCSLVDTRVDCPFVPLFVVTFLGTRDTLRTAVGTAVTAVDVHGGGGADDLEGTPNADHMFGEDDGDSLDAGAGNDTLDGGLGGDYLYDGAGDDILSGGPGDDHLIPGSGRDSFAGGDGTDEVDYSDRGGPLRITLDGVADDGEAGEGDNIGADVEGAAGGAAPDFIVGNPNGNRLHGRGGNDVIVGGSADDRVEGEEGDDVIDTRDGVYDSVDCGPGTDTVYADLGDATTNCEIAPDADGDGYGVPEDCAPLDPAIHPGAGEIYGNAIDEDCKDGPAYLRVISPISYSILRRLHPPSARFKKLVVSEVQAGDRIEVRCKGRGCPFKKRTRIGQPGKPTVNVAKLLKRRYLRRGAVLEIRVLRANQIGKVQRYRVVAGGAIKSTGLCLAVGATTPAPCA
jgi:Ca2+-binding RTX toxin-like protein